MAAACRSRHQAVARRQLPKSTVCCWNWSNRSKKTCSSVSRCKGTVRTRWCFTFASVAGPKGHEWLRVCHMYPEVWRRRVQSCVPYDLHQIRDLALVSRAANKTTLQSCRFSGSPSGTLRSPRELNVAVDHQGSSCQSSVTNKSTRYPFRKWPQDELDHRHLQDSFTAHNRSSSNSVTRDRQ